MFVKFNGKNDFQETFYGKPLISYFSYDMQQKYSIQKLT